MSNTVDDLLNAALTRARAVGPPGSTYRVQFHKGFTFRDAAAAVPYLAALGVTHLYASPYLKATPGSTHGYDVIDHCQLNPELGTQADFDALLAALRTHGLSHVLDTVPNHVGVATNDNKWWNDVLRRGPASPYAAYFDVAWRGSPRPELHDKVLLPLLGGHCGDVLDKGELKLVRENDGSLAVAYYDRRFPIDLATAEGLDLDATNADPAALDALLAKQHYRLSYWKTASDEINYRRFFDVNDLAALSMERPEVFEATHTFTLDLCASGAVAGLRIDHPDGLYDPLAYFLRLQQHYVLQIAKAVHASDPKYRAVSWDVVRPQLLARLEATDLSAGGWPLYVVAEKILAPREPLPSDWAVHGTSGYDFLNEVNGLFVDAAAEPKFTALYEQFTGDATPFHELVYAKKKLILELSLASELQMLARQLDRLAQRDRHSRDFTLNGLRKTLAEIIACFPVYRSYVRDDGSMVPQDSQQIQWAVDEAVRRNPKTDASVFHFVRDTLLQRYPTASADHLRADQRRFAGKFQQVTAPVTAKGIEDTAFYIYNRFVSLNEVGGEPSRFGVPPDDVHSYLTTRQRDWPFALSALSTHDTKRSEDVRARLNVLSEIPDEWLACVERWARINERHKTNVGGHAAPDRNEEYLIYQTLLGAWPLDPWSADEHTALIVRVQNYLQKALREAKVHTSWTDPNEPYEAAVKAFVTKLMTQETGGEFLDDFHRLRQRVSRFGLINGLAQTLVKLATPGVPDTYQGTALWDFSLVDPDNRRPVDYATRQSMLATLSAGLRESGDDHRSLARDLSATLPDGRAKLYATARALHARRQYPGLFTTGDYTPLTATGPGAEHLFAFARRHGTATAVAAVPRLPAKLEQRGGWADTRLI
ncbi:MAG TPA: malto-oligosyltrehalose synthase, partial [Tepidisphaeraceae bacterium]|nr:malto-oligosyltrehalose synthase [Tepidisphaeraceae bacterium]